MTSPKCDIRSDPGKEKLEFGNLPHLIVMGLSHAIIDMYAGMLPALVPFIQARFALSYSAAGAILAWSNLASSLVQPILGLVCDITGGIGPVIGGLILTSLAVTAMGCTNSYRMMVTAAIMAGLGAAIYHPQSASVMAYLSPKKRGSVMALFGIVGDMGFALGPLVLALLLSFDGSPLMWVGVLPGIMTGLIIKIVSLKPTGFDRSINFRVKTPIDTNGGYYGKLGKTQNMWFALIMVLGIATLRSFMQYSIIAFLPQYIDQVLGTSGNISPKLQSLFLVAGAFGTLVGGIFSDKFGKRLFVLISLVCLVPAHCGLYYVRNTSLFGILLIVEGFILMSTFSVGLVMSQDLLFQFPGLASGLYLGSCESMGGLGAVIVGYLADVKGLSFAFGSLALCPMIGFGLAFLLPDDKSGGLNLLDDLQTTSEHGIRGFTNKQLKAYSMEILRRYDLPEGIVNHSVIVAYIAEFIATRLRGSGHPVNIKNVIAAALLHDIGKSGTYVREKATNHAEASAEIVIKEGLGELAPIVSGHILDAIISENSAPLTWEQRIVFYADKIATHKLVSLEERFEDLAERHKNIIHLLDAAYEPTKTLEAHILKLANISWEDLKVHWACFAGE